MSAAALPRRYVNQSHTVMIRKQTESDFLAGVGRQQERQNAHKGDDGGRQDHVDDIVERTAT